MIDAIVNAYFRDYHDHVRDFRPVFLVNDILRFWKTLCLNYERKRNIQAETIEKKHKNHVRNVKLKFSRLLTCFSTVIPLVTMRQASPEEVIALTKDPPLERLHRCATTSAKALESYRELVSLYSAFLNTVERSDVVDWIGVEANRRAAFGNADEFAKVMFALLEELVQNLDTFRYLII